MEHIEKFKLRFGLPFIPFVVTCIIFAISASIAWYGLSLMLVPNQFDFGIDMFDAGKYITGIAFMLTGVLCFVLWLEAGLDKLIKKTS